MTPKPFVQAACVCEKVLREQDNVFSLIRIVDTYSLDTEVPALPDGFKAALPLSVLVALKSGDVVGEHEVGIRLVKPNGEVGPVRSWPVMFNSGEHGVNLQIGFVLDAPEFGLYWFDVLWADEVLTRIPLRVNSKTAAASPGPTEIGMTPP